MKRLLIPLFLLLTACSQNPWPALRESFQTPPDSVRVAVYWYWLDNNISKEGENTLEVTVYNNWRNRLIADEALPEALRGTWTNIQPWTVSDELQPSGLLGPVSIAHVAAND